MAVKLSPVYLRSKRYLSEALQVLQQQNAIQAEQLKAQDARLKAQAGQIKEMRKQLEALQRENSRREELLKALEADEKAWRSDSEKYDRRTRLLREDVNRLQRKARLDEGASAPREQLPALLKDWYYEKTGWRLEQEHPKTLNEKLQWFKLYGITPEIVHLADKYRVRDYVAERIGEKYLIPLLGVWQHPADIDFGALPNSFVLKANHGSNYNIIVRDKAALDIRAAVIRLQGFLREDFAYLAYEMQYDEMPRVVFAETYLENAGGELYDFKVWCFGGHAEFIQVISGRSKQLAMSFYDRDWQLTGITQPDYAPSTAAEERPANLEELLACAEKLAEGFPFVRVDFYRTDDGRLWFGEMTFTPNAGAFRWDPPETDALLGAKVHYPGLPE